MEVVRKVPGTADLDTSQERQRAEVRVQLDRRAASDPGLNLGTVALTVRGLVAGEVISQFEDPHGDSYDVRLELDAAQRTEREDLMQIDLPAQGGQILAPLSQVARLEEGDCAFQDPAAGSDAGDSHQCQEPRAVHGRSDRGHQTGGDQSEFASGIPDRLHG